MYYITNQNNQIIAIDPSLLALLKVENIDELYRKTALGDITFSSLTAEDSKITITTVYEEETYDAVCTDLSGILGDITLVQIQTSPEASISIDNDTAPIEDLLSIGTDEEDIIFKEVKDEDEPIEESPAIETDEEDIISILDDTFKEVEDEDKSIKDLLSTENTEEDMISILDDTLEEISDDKEGSKESIEDLLSIDTDEEDIISILDDTPIELHTADTEIDDLIMPTAPEEAIDEISLLEKEEAEVIDDNHTPIIIDVKNISKSIGISTEEYNTFLNEYIDTALSLENDLLGTQEEQRTHAIGILSHLSHVLHLPVISEIVTQIETATASNQKIYIEFFYATLGRLTTTQSETDQKEEKLEVKKEEATAEPTPATESFGTINLNNVKPIHFDFQLESAANDLSLPVELIEEFVHDFIEQAHTETKNMLEAYEKGDLDTIQKIGHLLKGASSNLRIEALSDTLYEIQFCEDSSNLEHLIKDYWAHFLSLETQINLISSKE